MLQEIASCTDCAVTVGEKLWCKNSLAIQLTGGVHSTRPSVLAFGVGPLQKASSVCVVLILRSTLCSDAVLIWGQVALSIHSHALTCPHKHSLLIYEQKRRA